ncbi:uncharacterized protein LOC110247189 [Exaiptasia diaphana]|uniref:Uncharacterized protein n=1 Tax=Exaiptasia diaphana TaxID=2652724 RepID=A0A913XRV2_EXADI|nr:uncharacterized protein LOC110247189 [Exaiptasia diaphana]KXJ24691.1 hypothetical protein AC249_AIPGENE21084 [Exaiptasia diaphana]
MAGLKVLLVIVLTSLAVDESMCHVVPTSKQSQSSQSFGASAISSLMIFSQQLKSLEDTVKRQNKKIENQNDRLEKLKASINDKATKFSVHKVRSELRNKFDVIRQDLEMRKRGIEQYRNKMNKLENIISTTQSDYSDIEMKVDVVRERFDDLSTKCRRVKTGWNNRANGEILFLDRHYLSCRSNEFIHSFLLERRSDVPWSMVRYVYECCKYTI